MGMKKEYGVAVLLALSLSIVSQPMDIFATTTAGEQNSSIEEIDPGNEVPVFTSPEEALNAANLAEEAALDDDDLKTALSDLKNAHDALLAAEQSRNRNAISAARRTLETAEKNYMKELSQVSGVAEPDINSMHDAGMNWGKIGHELGVNPDMLGLGHDINDIPRNQGMKREIDHMSGVGVQELNEATARNMESGWFSGHGSNIQAGIHEPGSGVYSSDMISGAGGMMSSAGKNDNHGSMGGNDHDSGMSAGSMESENSWGGSSSSSSGNQDHDTGGMNGNDHSGGSGGHGGGSEGNDSGGHEGSSGDHGGKW